MSDMLDKPLDEFENAILNNSDLPLGTYRRVVRFRIIIIIWKLTEIIGVDPGIWRIEEAHLFKVWIIDPVDAVFQYGNLKPLAASQHWRRRITIFDTLWVKVIYDQKEDKKQYIW